MLILVVLGCGVPRAGLGGDASIRRDSSTDANMCLRTGVPTDICNGFDDDCDGSFDEDQADRPCAGGSYGRSCVNVCLVGGGFDAQCVHTEGLTVDECDNLVDDDCDGSVDESCVCTIGDMRPCGCGGMQRCGSGTWEACAGERAPVPEICNAADEDCDGVIDEEPTDAADQFLDRDGDGFGDSATPIASCDPVAGYVSTAGDCDDGAADTHPGGTEVCGGGDEDCDGNIDEGVGGTYYRDSDGDGFGDPAVSVEACSMPAGHVLDATDCDDDCAACHPAYPTEVCDDGADNDCNGDTDDRDCECFFEATGSGLYLVCDDVERSWSAAEMYCADHGGQLASINSSSEQDDVWGALDPTGLHFWIGGEDVGRDGSWEWVDGSMLADCDDADSSSCTCDYCNWRSGRPDNSDSHCVFLDKNQNGLWDDKPCTDTNPFVCEF